MMPAVTRNRIIGLLGGSFNPAHNAHLYLSLYALKSLPLDEIWWLVAPQNPLKSTKGMAPYEQRLQSAQHMVQGHRRIRVMDFEMRHHCYYTHQTITQLQRRFRGTYFVWLMGADNLSQFHRWQKWQDIASKIPIMVFDRSPDSHRAPRCRAYSKNRRFLIKNIGINNLKQAPALAFCPMPRQALSSSWLRKTLGARAFLGHNENAGR